MSDHDTTIFIAITNEYAPDYSKQDLKKLAKAINQQLKDDFRPLWPGNYMPEVFASDDCDDIFKKNTNYWPVYLHPGNATLWAAGIKGTHSTMRRTVWEDTLSGVTLALPSNIKRLETTAYDRPYALVLTKSAVATSYDKFTEVSKELSAQIMRMIIDPRHVRTSQASFRTFEFGADMLSGILTVDGAPFVSLDMINDCVDPVRMDSYTRVVDATTDRKSVV